MACVDHDKLDGGGNFLSWSTQTESWPESTKITWNIDRILLSWSTQAESWPVSTKINWNENRNLLNWSTQTESWPTKINWNVDLGRHKQNHGLCRPNQDKLECR